MVHKYNRERERDKNKERCHGSVRTQRVKDMREPENEIRNIFRSIGKLYFVQPFNKKNC